MTDTTAVTAPSGQGWSTWTRRTRLATIMLGVTCWFAYRGCQFYSSVLAPTIPATFVAKVSRAYPKQGRINRVTYSYILNGCSTLEADDVCKLLYERAGPDARLRTRLFTIAGFNFNRLDRTWTERVQEVWDDGFGILWFALSGAFTVGLPLAITSVALRTIAVMKRRLHQRSADFAG